MLTESNGPLSWVETSQLDIAYFSSGLRGNWPCILIHGFPYDVHCYEKCLAPLVEAGAFVIVPYIRGYGPTRFLSASTLRSGEQAVLANDLLELMNALSIDRAVLAGFDWGGRAACIVSALWPERVSALVSGNSYHSPRGRAGLQQNRSDIARLLWRMWSPTWRFGEEDFQRTATSFTNPDFVDVVIHSYRHRFGLEVGDPGVAHIEHQLEAQPCISVPAITIDGSVSGISGSTACHAVKFTGPHEHRIFENAGHNLPQEKPLDWVQAILDARQLSI